MALSLLASSAHPVPVTLTLEFCLGELTCVRACISLPSSHEHSIPNQARYPHLVLEGTQLPWSHHHTMSLANEWNNSDVQRRAGTSPEPRYHRLQGTAALSPPVIRLNPTYFQRILSLVLVAASSVQAKYCDKQETCFYAFILTSINQPVIYVSHACHSSYYAHPTTSSLVQLPCVMQPYRIVHSVHVPARRRRIR